MRSFTDKPNDYTLVIEGTFSESRRRDDRPTTDGKKKQKKRNEREDFGRYSNSFRPTPTPDDPPTTLHIG